MFESAKTALTDPERTDSSSETYQEGLDSEGLLDTDLPDDSVADQLIALLDLADDQAEFLRTYEENYGRDGLRDRIKESLDWEKMKPYPDLETNPDPT